MLSLSHIIKHSAAAMKFHLRMFGTAKGAAHIDGLLVDLTCLVAQPDRQTEDFGSRSGASSGLFGARACVPVCMRACVCMCVCAACL